MALKDKGDIDNHSDLADEEEIRASKVALGAVNTMVLTN